MTSASFISGFPSHIPIEPDDIQSVLSPTGWLTDTAIRTLLLHYGNHTSTSYITLLDPTWLAEYEHLSLSPSHLIPDFLLSPTPGGNAPIGLAIPFNESNGHWTVIYANLEARGAIYFNSLPSWGTARAERVMRKFFEEFEIFFGPGTGEWRWVVDERCARQEDTNSCGIYAVRNLLDLLDHRRPGAEELGEEQRGNFRKNAGAFLERLMKGDEEPLRSRSGRRREMAPVLGGLGNWPNFYEGNAKFGAADKAEITGTGTGFKSSGDALKDFSKYFFSSGRFGIV
ncbi:hypothetical protein EG329_003259 [Mollisiaceae sp. DMI_Dod_QoI]|nr:hypothetical protein EG329_003259 [Helotiales sp. DMI_Dod_QoI]